MNGRFASILLLAAVGLLLLTAGCRKSAQQQFASPSFLLESAIAGVDEMKVYLPRKDGNELTRATAGMSGALTKAVELVPSAEGKAKVQKASDTYEKELRPAIMSLNYDPATMIKKMDEIRATLVEVSKEVK